MQQHMMRPPKGAKKNRKRVGRGDGSGMGTYSGRGLKGQKSRSGSGAMVKFQGGQLSLLKRLPSIRGFTNIFRQEYSVVNIDQLALYPAGSEVTPDSMVQVGFVKNMNSPVKVLGRGDIDVAISVSAHKFSAAARSKIEAAGGTVSVTE
jgi:large subunit ribosomal protein L15